MSLISYARLPLTADRQALCRRSAAAAATLLLAACGGEAPKQAGPPVVNEQLVFTAAADCAASQRLKPESCTQAMNSALQQHLARAPIHKTEQACEKAEGGPGKCEREDVRAFRPRLVAVAVHLGDAARAEAANQPVTGTPLYPTLGGEQGFRTIDKRVLVHDADMISFSPQAVAAAELTSAAPPP